MRHIPIKVWISILAVIIIAVGSAVFLVWPKERESPREASVTTPRTTGSKTESGGTSSVAEIPPNWTTYTDKTLGYQVSYPQDWEKPEEGPVPDPTVLYFGANEAPDMEEAVIIAVQDITANTTITPPYGSPEEWKQSEITVNGSRAVRYEKEYSVASVRGTEGPFVYREIDVKIECKGKLYELSLRRDTQDSDAFTTFEEMVKSFNCNQ